jgi:hypothetical protein
MAMATEQAIVPMNRRWSDIKADSGGNLSSSGSSMSSISIDDSERDHFGREEATESARTEPTPVTKGLHAQFGAVTIYEFSLRLCENPGSQSGPAIGIDRVIVETQFGHIEDYEELQNIKKCGSDQQKRRLNELRISRLDREQLLKDEGYSTAQIEEAIREQASVVKSANGNGDTSGTSAFLRTGHHVKSLVAALAPASRPPKSDTRLRLLSGNDSMRMSKSSCLRSSARRFRDSFLLGLGHHEGKKCITALSAKLGDLRLCPRRGEKSNKRGSFSSSDSD